jgi:hypothetical protein
MLDDIFDLASLITGWVRKGLKTEEILARLNDPDNVGRTLLERAVKRREAGAAYLGRGGTGDEG